MSAIRFRTFAVMSLMIILSVPGFAKPGNTSGVTLVKGDDAVDVLIDGKLFTSYIFAGAPKPYCYPIIGPTGQPVTRDYPMKQVAGETRDHSHHRSMWFTFGNVNGIDFWTEGPKAGKIVHREFSKLRTKSGVGWIRTTNDWIGPDGKKVCEDTRDIRVYDGTADCRVMDFAVTIRATEGPVKLGDTKEGMFGIRVADSMTVDKGKGHIQLSGGERDGKAWGKQGDWCDFYGQVDGETVGIAVMEHPTSFRHPTYWHARTYGLLGANPFGLKDFTGDKTKDGSCTIPKGLSVTFRYRIIIHKGDSRQADIAGRYAAYVKSPDRS
jgi:hypothetical protein